MTGRQETLLIPCFDTFRANVTLPKNNGGGSSPVDVQLESSTDKTLGAPSPAPGSGTPLFYESVKTDNRVALEGTVVTANISSEKRISPDHTYNADVYLDGLPVATETGLVPIGHNLYITIDLTPGFVFPGGRPVQIVLYESS